MTHNIIKPIKKIFRFLIRKSPAPERNTPENSPENPPKTTEPIQPDTNPAQPAQPQEPLRKNGEFRHMDSVIIWKNLGKQAGHSSNEHYYHGGTINKIPLGTRAKITQIDSRYPQRIMVLTSKGDQYYFHPDEIKLDDEIKIHENTRGLALILDKEPEKPEKKNGENHHFEPKFNAREEFALWIRQEFPELDRYTGQGEVYEDLEKRKDEVMSAARLAYKHATSTTNSCVNNQFGQLWSYLESSVDAIQLSYNLKSFISKIEEVAPNFGGQHYGTYIRARART